MITDKQEEFGPLDFIFLVIFMAFFCALTHFEKLLLQNMPRGVTIPIYFNFSVCKAGRTSLAVYLHT